MTEKKNDLQQAITDRLEFTGKTTLADAERQAIAYHIWGNMDRWREVPEGIQA